MHAGVHVRFQHVGATHSWVCWMSWRTWLTRLTWYTGFSIITRRAAQSLESIERVRGVTTCSFWNHFVTPLSLTYFYEPLAVTWSQKTYNQAPISHPQNAALNWAVLPPRGVPSLIILQHFCLQSTLYINLPHYCTSRLDSLTSAREPRTMWMYKYSSVFFSLIYFPIICCLRTRGKRSPLSCHVNAFRSCSWSNTPAINVNNLPPY